MPEQLRSCPSCEAPVPEGARFCPSCGAALEAGTTRREQVPPHETTPSPVRLERVTPRWFGVTPATLVFGLALGAVVLSTVLLVSERWVGGLLVLGLALLLFAAFLEVARRKPDAQVARRAAEAAGSVRARAGFAANVWLTRSTARREIGRRRAELVHLAAQREALLRELGDGTYRGADTAATRERIAAVDARGAQLELEVREIAERARAQVEQEALAVQPTEVARPGDSD